MKLIKGMAIATVSMLGAVSLASIVSAAQLGDGTVYFDRPPSVVNVSATRNTVADATATYYFTLNLPENAGEPLQTVLITQENNTSPLGEIEFDPDEVEAFLGTRRRRGDALALGDVVWTENDYTLSVTFDPPVAPGTDVTLRIEPDRNPRRSGVYLFGITAFPRGDNPSGQFLGYGRLHFYDRGDRLPFSFREESYWRFHLDSFMTED